MSDIDVVKNMFERGIISCRLSKLSITKCKRFKEKADFNFIFPLTVLVGQNGSGKTTVTRAIKLLKSNYEPQCEFLKPRLTMAVSQMQGLIILLMVINLHISIR